MMHDKRLEKYVSAIMKGYELMHADAERWAELYADPLAQESRQTEPSVYPAEGGGMEWRWDGVQWIEIFNT